jgi:hypothetical protein
VQKRKPSTDEELTPTERLVSFFILFDLDSYSYSDSDSDSESESNLIQSESNIIQSESESNLIQSYSESECESANYLYYSQV